MLYIQLSLKLGLSVIEIIPSAEILLRPSTICDPSVVSETDMPRLAAQNKNYTFCNFTSHVVDNFKFDMYTALQALPYLCRHVRPRKSETAANIDEILFRTFQSRSTSIMSFIIPT